MPFVGKQQQQQQQVHGGTITILSILLLASFPLSASAFTSFPKNNNGQATTFATRKGTPTTATTRTTATTSRSQVVTASRLDASIISPSWEDEHYVDDHATTGTASFLHQSSSTSTIPTNNPIAAVTNFLETEAMDRLARLAVAFSPPEHMFQLKDVEHIEVISLNEDSIDIEAMLCENDGCVSLSVPITFPKSCRGSDDFEACVVDNIGALDVRASEVLRTKTWKAKFNQEAGMDADLQLQMLRDADNISFPKWWISPAVAEDCQRECNYILKLLNDDEFVQDVQNLALAGVQQASLRSLDDDKIYSIELAAVAAVGPAGLIMRACLRDARTGQLDILELPMAFQQPANDAENLRAAVLGAVASVEA